MSSKVRFFSREAKNLHSNIPSPSLLHCVRIGGPGEVVVVLAALEKSKIISKRIVVGRSSSPIGQNKIY